MDPRIELYKAAFGGGGQYGGAGGNIPVFKGAYRYQYGQGFGDVLRGIWRFFRPMAIKGGQTLLKAGGEATRDGTYVKDAIKSTLKPTLGAVVEATAEQIASRLSSGDDHINKPAAAPPPGPPIVHPESVQIGTEATGLKGSGASSRNRSGKKRSRTVYKKKSFKRANYSHSTHPILYNF